MWRSTYCSMPTPIAAPKRSTTWPETGTPVAPPCGATDMKLAPEPVPGALGPIMFPLFPPQPTPSNATPKAVVIRPNVRVMKSPNSTVTAPRGQHHPRVLVFEVAEATGASRSERSAPLPAPAMRPTATPALPAIVLRSQSRRRIVWVRAPGTLPSCRCARGMPCSNAAFGWSRATRTGFSLRRRARLARTTPAQADHGYGPAAHRGGWTGLPGSVSFDAIGSAGFHGVGHFDSLNGSVLMATITVLPDISTAPRAGVSNTPHA